jgi:hypothetical protein
VSASYFRGLACRHLRRATERRAPGDERVTIRREPSDDVVQCPQNIGVRYANDVKPKPREVDLAPFVVEALVVVNASIDFNREAELETIEVDDVACDHVLTAKSPSLQAALAQYAP